MNRREFIGGAALAAQGAALAAAAGLAGCATAGGRAADGRRGCVSSGLSEDWSGNGDMVLSGVSIPAPLRVWFVADSHLNLRDARDAAYEKNMKRMGGEWSKTLTVKGAFIKVMAAAKKAKPDLIVALGDTFSFPSLLNVSFTKEQLDATGIPWLYVAGNHDWHFEGEPGTQDELRAKWTRTRMAPLYCGRDPMAQSCVVKGVRFVLIDDSTNQVSPAQLDYYRREAAKGDPLCLCMHVPLWFPGLGNHTCGCPDWGAKVDEWYAIEGRPKWPEHASDSTFAFREAVLSTPNLVGAFAGHIHRWQFAQADGHPFVTAKAAMGGQVLRVTFMPEIA